MINEAEMILAIDELWKEIGQDDERVKQLHADKSLKQWKLGELLFGLFGRRSTTPSGLSIEQFATARGKSHQAVSVPLRIYRFLGAWRAEKTVNVPYTIAKLTVRHDAEASPTLMDLWLQEGRPTEKEWAAFLEQRSQLIAEQDKPPKDKDALKRWATKRANQYAQLLEKAAIIRKFPLKILPPRVRERVAKAVMPHVSKRGGMYKRKKKIREAAEPNHAAESRTEASESAPAAELLAACDA